MHGLFFILKCSGTHFYYFSLDSDDIVLYNSADIIKEVGYVFKDNEADE